MNIESKDSPQHTSETLIDSDATINSIHLNSYVVNSSDENISNEFEPDKAALGKKKQGAELDENGEVRDPYFDAATERMVEQYKKYIIHIAYFFLMLTIS